jgi:hypothetical protein
MRKAHVSSRLYDASALSRAAQLPASAKGKAMVRGKAWVIAIIGSLWLAPALAQGAIGGPNKPKNYVGGATSQTNPVVPVHPGAAAKPTSLPKK